MKLRSYEVGDAEAFRLIALSRR